MSQLKHTWVGAVAVAFALLPCLAWSADVRPKLKRQEIRVERKGNPLPAHGTPADAFEMVQLPAGKIELRKADGSNVEHRIKPVWIGVHEVRWDEYDVFWAYADLTDAERQNLRAAEAKQGRDAKSRPSQPYEPPDRGWGHYGSPAIGIHYRAARLYCEWLTKMTGKKFRLPTEAEWEYACRAGGEAPAGAAALKKVAWFEANSDDQTHSVGKKEPNAWGLYDTLGNAAEWVTTDNERVKLGVAAGGSYMDPAEEVHPGARVPFDPAWQRADPDHPKSLSWLSNGSHVGFRVVMDE